MVSVPERLSNFYMNTFIRSLKLRIRDPNSIFHRKELNIFFRFCERSLHQQFLQDASLTDVTTFPGDPQFGLAGEIIVCLTYAEQQAKRFHTGLDDEIKLYLIHGFLHLAGFK